MIEIKNLKFKYHQDQPSYILDDVSFHVKRGEWLSIVGHNGSGKSTTARLIDGLLVAESGQIIVDGQELTEDNVWDIRDKIGMVFQSIVDFISRQSLFRETYRLRQNRQVRMYLH